MHHPSEDTMNPIVRLAELNREASPAYFRAAMRRLAGGVSVITVGSGDQVSGMTVTSVSSLAVDPPSLIVSVNRASSSWPLLQRHPFFGVNMLTADQVDVAERFSGKDGLKGAERFAGAAWTERASGVRLLSGALAGIECEAEDIIERHSHAIVIGRVLHVELAPDDAALAYWHGDYVAIDREEDMVRLADVSLPAGHVRDAGAISRFSRREG
jgi:flavin reductase (DIM6/NTAB) family NADH-FMN oxidoreductase RutF